MQRLAFGPFVLDSARGVLLRDGRTIPVNEKGIRLLAALLRAPGEAVSKSALMDAAWPGIAVEESNLSVQIAALRKLLGAAHDGGEWIATVPRIGYRFVGAVADADTPTDSAGGADARPLIAVLPFGIASEEIGKEYLADGITDDIITALARYRWFRVVVRGSAFALRDRAADQLGARYALHGNVRHSGERLRISAQLIDTSDGAHLWAERYDLAMADVFAIQDEIAERVVAAIEPELLKSESRFAIVHHTGNMTAWDLVRQGMWHFHKVTREGHRAAPTSRISSPPSTWRWSRREMQIDENNVVDFAYFLILLVVNVLPHQLAGTVAFPEHLHIDLDELDCLGQSSSRKDELGACDEHYQNRQQNGRPSLGKNPFHRELLSNGDGLRCVEELV